MNNYIKAIDIISEETVATNAAEGEQAVLNRILGTVEAVLNNVDIFAGITILVNICNLLALKVSAIFIFSLSVLINPFSIFNIVCIIFKSNIY